MKDIKQDGLTLIELLGAITIGAIIIGLVSSVLIGSVTNFNKTLTHSNLRQEANLVITELTKVHHKYSDYTIEIENDLIKVTDYDQTWFIGNSNYIYFLPKTTINASDDYLNIILTITDTNNQSKTFETSTVINRR